MGTGKVRRRELIAIGAMTGVVAATAGAATPSDASQLRTALAIELLTVYSYDQILRGGTLTAAGRHLVGEILVAERAHVRQLTAELSRMGETPPARPTTRAEADKQLAARQSSGSLGGLHTEADSLRLLYDIESIAVGAYYEAIHKLGAPRLLRTAAEIMASEAQHAVAIGELLHPGDIRRTVPNSLVTGKH
jgi:Ferritin-like domain